MTASAPPVPAPAPRPPAPAPVPAGGPGPAPDSARPATTDTGVPAAAFGPLPGGSFAARLGGGFTLSADQLAEEELDLTGGPQPVPGLVLRRAQLLARGRKLRLTADLAVPHLVAGEVTVDVDQQGRPDFRGRVRSALEVPALGSPTVTVTLDEGGRLAGSLAFDDLQLAPARPRGVDVVGSGELRLAAGRFSGDVTATLTYRDLGTATATFRFSETGAFTADGRLQVTPPFLAPVGLTLGVDAERNITADLTAELAGQASPLPGLVLTGGTFTVHYGNGEVTGSLTGFAASYTNLATVSIATLEIDRNRQWSGDGTLLLAVPMLDEVQGALRVRRGRVSGSLRVAASAFPEGLPVRSGSITASLGEDGAVSFAGAVRVDLGPAGRGELTGAWAAGVLDLGADVLLTVPGLQPVRAVVAYVAGALTAEVSVPVDSALLPGLTGLVVVRYREGLWSGETTLGYAADGGRLSGTVTVVVTQTESGSLQVSGSGSVTAQLLPNLAGTLTATILPEGGVDVSGEIVVPEPIELFPERRLERELFRHSQNIPLWAILVAVIRVRAGVRAGIGPGVFRNIKIEGSYTLGAEEGADPSFTVGGELYIPAFVEGYVSFGAGLGLDVVLGELTGGIEAVATAGLYGAVSVVPEIGYADGQWSIDGTATLAAGARLKVGLNAWAEVEALWVTVWDNEWKLAEHTTPLGPDLALRAHVHYVFGRPEPPELDFDASSVDTEALIQGAMPEDGPPASGAREALENKAEWQGMLREQRQAPVPPELAAEAGAAERPPEPAVRRRTGQRPGPPAAGPAASGPGPNRDPGSQPGAATEPARSAAVDAAAAPSTVPPSVPESQVPASDEPRYPKAVTLAMLDEPPAPEPRTSAQKEQDLTAARQAVELASAASTDSDALDNYFPRIRNRFRLGSLGYEGDFTRGFRVVGRINPEFALQPDEPLTGTGIPGDLQPGHITRVEFQTSTLGGDQVGIRMTAQPLGPDHPQGSGPSGQVNLMGLLPTDPGIYREADQRYIRGHLLNDNVGGPGQPRNLFPITAHANAVHHAEIEQAVKDWVNTRRYWVRYTVEVRGQDVIDRTPSGINYVNSSIVAEASVLDTELQPVSSLTRKVTIASTFGAPATASAREREDAEALAGHTARDVDSDVEVLLSTTKGDTTVTFPDAMETLLKERIDARSTTWVKMRLATFPQFGPKSEEVLFKAYDEVKRRRDKTVHGLAPGEVATFTRIRNAWGQGLAATLT